MSADFDGTVINSVAATSGYARSASLSSPGISRQIVRNSGTGEAISGFSAESSGETPSEPAKTAEALDSVVAESNDWMLARKRSIRFRIQEDMDRVQVQVVDPLNDRIIRSIPSDEMLRFSERLRQLSGLGALVDESR
ncbi:MAG: flagellar protein FlaG [Planctomycetota bacterium]|jgi:flagellar protein FlaG|nr:flagellar protein FlaG [Planctomycetota bacterium]